jgi:beta-lactamase class A
MDLLGLFEEAGCTGSLHAVRLSDAGEVAHEADRPQVLASVVKVPIGLEFYAQVEGGLLDPTEPISLLPGMRTPGPVGISQFEDSVTLSLRDLSYLMLTISDNAATDAVTAAVGIDAINRRLDAIGCRETVLVSSLQDMLDGAAVELGHEGYADLVAAQSGEMGPMAKVESTDPNRIDRCRALDPLQTSRTTARDATRLLSAVWSDSAASSGACATLRNVMGQQVTRRVAPAIREGGSLAAKSGALFGRVRNEIAVITDPDGETYAVAVLTRARRPFVGAVTINAAMASAVTVRARRTSAIVDGISRQKTPGEQTHQGPLSPR